MFLQTPNKLTPTSSSKNRFSKHPNVVSTRKRKFCRDRPNYICPKKKAIVRDGPEMRLLIKAKKNMDSAAGLYLDGIKTN